MFWQEFNNYFIAAKDELITNQTNFYTWKLLESFVGKNIHWHMHNCCPDFPLPVGCNGYIIGNEGPCLQWLFDQADSLAAPVFVLNVCNNTYFSLNELPYKNIHILPWVDMHYQFKAMINDYPSKVKKNVSKKISCLVRMSKTNKLVALAAVLKYHAHNSITSFHNKHYQDATDIDTKPTQHQDFDKLLEEIKIYCKETKILDDINLYEHGNNDTDFQKKISNFHADTYQCCAININNESFFRTHHRYPLGPFFTEKTFNCLLGETAFLANGQRETYSTLERLGFQFNYGIDLSYDKLPGDLDRMVSLYNLIESLQKIDTNDIFEQTRDSCLANKEHALSDKFYNLCENINEETVNKIHSLL